MLFRIFLLLCCAGGKKIDIAWRGTRELTITVYTDKNTTVRCASDLEHRELGPRWTNGEISCMYTGKWTGNIRLVITHPFFAGTVMCDSEPGDSYLTVNGCQGQDTVIALSGWMVPNGGGNYFLGATGRFYELSDDLWGPGVQNGSAQILNDMAGTKRFIGADDSSGHRQHISRFSKVPKKASITIKVCYDVSLLRKFRGLVKKVENFVLNVVSYGQHNFRHPTLGTEVS